MKYKKWIRYAGLVLFSLFFVFNAIWIPYYMKCRKLYKGLIAYYGTDTVVTKEYRISGTMPGYLRYNARFYISQKMDLLSHQLLSEEEFNLPDIFLFPRSFGGVILASNNNRYVHVAENADGTWIYEIRRGYFELDKNGIPIGDKSKMAWELNRTAYEEIMKKASDIWGVPSR